MKIALIDAKRSRVVIANQTTVNFRNMLALQREIDAVGIFDVYGIRRYMETPFDVFICGFGSYSNDFKMTVELFNRNPNARIFWLCGEYEQNSYWSIIAAKRKFTVIKNFTGRGHISHYDDLCIGEHVMNINLLMARPANPMIEKLYDCVYFGRWRPGRAKYFLQYLHPGIYLSTSSKNYKQFKRAGCNPELIKPLSWIHGRETLNRFRYSLYIEDEYTHGVFNHLGNRWYENGFCNCVTLFDANCINTIRQSEIGQFEKQIMAYIVTDHADMMDRIKWMNENFEMHLAIQKSWRLSESILRRNFIQQFKNIINNQTA
jgi:hypothetical protein